jgi:hypothetical protein
VNVSLRLPALVFCRDWASYFLLSSDRLFHEPFIEVALEMLEIENGSMCCFLNITRSPLLEFQSVDAYYFDMHTSADEFNSHLTGGGPASGWIFSMDRYVCASDQGSWCIYCEKENDLAVVGTAREISAAAGRTLAKLGAYPASALAVDKPPLPFPLSDLRPEWKAALLKNYNASSSSHHRRPV